jgi:hypothetical protein
LLAGPAGLSSSLFNDFRDSLCIGKPTAATEGGVSGLALTGLAKARL